jgi:hypothetical protein
MPLLAHCPDESQADSVHSIIWLSLFTHESSIVRGRGKAPVSDARVMARNGPCSMHQCRPRADPGTTDRPGFETRCKLTVVYVRGKTRTTGCKIFVACVLLGPRPVASCARAVHTCCNAMHNKLTTTRRPVRNCAS